MVSTYAELLPIPCFLPHCLSETARRSLTKSDLVGDRVIAPSLVGAEVCVWVHGIPTQAVALQVYSPRECLCLVGSLNATKRVSIANSGTQYDPARRHVGRAQSWPVSNALSHPVLLPCNPCHIPWDKGNHSCWDTGRRSTLPAPSVVVSCESPPYGTRPRRLEKVRRNLSDVSVQGAGVIMILFFTPLVEMKGR